METNANGTLIRRHLLDIARRYGSLPGDDATEVAERAQRLEPAISALSSGIFRVVMMGEVKKGKTSCINALLGREGFLPVDDEVATSTVYKLVYGPVEKMTVFFLPKDADSDDTPEPRQIQREQLRDYGTEAGNPDNQKNVDFIAIELSDPLLKEGVVITDTPGIGGLFRKHRETTFKYAPSADVVLFACDSVEAPINETEAKFIKEVSTHTRRLVFLQTKSDVVSQEQCEAFRTRNLKILCELLGVDASEIPYFLVSSKLKSLADRNLNAEHLKESGFLDLIQFVRNDLIPNRDAILSEKWVGPLAGDIAAAGHNVAERLAIAKQTGTPRLEDYAKQLRAAEQEFEQWQAEKWPPLQRRFNEEVSRCKRQFGRRLQDSLSPDSPAFTEAIANLRDGCQKAEQVQEQAADALNAFAAWCDDESMSVLREYRDAFCAAYLTSMREASADLGKIRLPELRTEVAAPIAGDAGMMAPLRDAYWNSRIIGGIAGTGSWLAGGVGGWVIMMGHPIGWGIVAAAAVGKIATTIWSAVKGWTGGRKRQRDAALSSVERAMRKTAQAALRVSGRAFDDLATELDSKAADALSNLAKQARTQFKQRKSEVEAGKTRTEGELKRAIADLSSRLQALLRLSEELFSIASPKREATAA